MSNRNKKTEKELEKDIEDLKQELDKKAKLSEERLNKLKYLQADFDNYRKKFEKEKEEIIKLANENLIKELLVVLEDFERSLKQVNDIKNREGLLLVYKNFLNILEKHGLRQIEALGRKFDHNFHEVLSKEKSDKEDGVILEEYQKGFILKSKVIRPSKVKISEKIIVENGRNKNE